ncbi:MAG: hypothetical protein F6K09_13015, partial [Merismopedia sp. SIO2A8]|nr:hypothetical protein [Merismopedia sp. SIO2A8]
MEDYLEILTDNRVQERGSEKWNFTLRLWSKEKEQNLRLFEQEWEKRRPQKSKQQEAATVAAPVRVKRIRPKAGVPFQAPHLPTYFVERPEVSQKLKQCLLSETTNKTGTLVVSAIYGLGGIGKSTLAAALAHDREVQAHFPDGILWATLGQQPDLLSLLSTWIQELKDYNFKPTTPESASMHLRTLLSDKAALLVVDDAWSPEHVEPFQVGSASCRVLVTTREALIVGAIRYDLDVMKPEQAIALLEQWRGNLTRAERKQAQALASTVGYLPLALELAAAHVADGISWSELLTDLRREIAILETLDLPGAEDIGNETLRKKYSLLASFNLSLKRLAPEYLHRFAWLGVLPEDAFITPKMAVTLWEVNQRQTLRSLRYLRSKALLLPAASLADGTQSYRLHDLLHDLARRLLTVTTAPTQENNLTGLGLTMPQAHAALLERYRAKTENGLWHTLPDDGYIHAHLSWHLLEAGWIEQLHQLLREETPEGHNGWYQACDHLGQLESYIQDVARAWKLAEDAFIENQSNTIGLQCRYALIISSLNSLFTSIPPELIVVLLEKQIWTPEKSLTYARQEQDSFRRQEILFAIAPHLPPKLLPGAL